MYRITHTKILYCERETSRRKIVRPGTSYGNERRVGLVDWRGRCKVCGLSRDCRYVSSSFVSMTGFLLTSDPLILKKKTVMFESGHYWTRSQQGDSGNRLTRQERVFLVHRPRSVRKSLTTITYNSWMSHGAWPVLQTVCKESRGSHEKFSPWQ